MRLEMEPRFSIFWSSLGFLASNQPLTLTCHALCGVLVRQELVLVQPHDVAQLTGTGTGNGL
eukprot:7894033-Prorocentrum_lima.AAC.1